VSIFGNVIAIPHTNTTSSADIHMQPKRYCVTCPFQNARTKLEILIISNIGHHLADTFWTYGRIFKISINKTQHGNMFRPRYSSWIGSFCAGCIHSFR